MEQYGFDGVDINWEQIQTSDNTDFTSFIANLRAALTTAVPETHLLLTMPPETKPNGGRPDLLALVYQVWTRSTSKPIKCRAFIAAGKPGTTRL